MKILRIFVAVVVATAMLAGCSHMSATQQRMLSGGAIGTGAGAAISAIAGGSVLTGAAIGAGAGVLGGFIYDEIQRSR